MKRGKTMRCGWMGIGMLWTLTLSGSALAQEAAAQGDGAADRGSQKKGRVVTISEVTIVGRIQKPIAAIDVSRIQPKLTLAEVRQPFADRIEKAIYEAPF